MTLQILDTIVDTSENIRIEARNILKLAKLSDLKLVNKCIDGVLKGLEMYPKVAHLPTKIK